MALVDRYLLTQSEEFSQRVTMAVETAALQIIREPLDMRSKLSRARWSEALRTVNSSEIESKPYISALAADPAISSDSPDQQLLDAVLGLWNVMTGVPVRGG